MIYAAPSATFTATAEGFATGLTGTLGVRIRTAAGVDVVARTIAGITEGVDPDFSGIVEYTVSLTAPTTVGNFEVVWDDGSGNVATEALTTTYSPTGASQPLYITAAQLKATLTMASTTYADADIAAAIAAACRTIDSLCGRRFYADTDALQVRYYSPTAADWLEIDDLATFTSLATDPGGDGTFEQTWTLNTDFVLEPLDAQSDTQNVKPWTSIAVHPRGSYPFPTYYPRTVKLTGQFGWPAVPSAIVNAATLLANLLLTVSRSAPLGIVPFEGGAIRVARGNPQVMMLLTPLMRHRIGVG